MLACSIAVAAPFLLAAGENLGFKTTIWTELDKLIKFHTENQKSACTCTKINQIRRWLSIRGKYLAKIRKFSSKWNNLNESKTNFI